MDVEPVLVVVAVALPLAVPEAAAVCEGADVPDGAAEEEPPDEPEAATKGFGELPPVPEVRSRLKRPSESCCEMDSSVLVESRALPVL